MSPPTEFLIDSCSDTLEQSVLAEKLSKEQNIKHFISTRINKKDTEFNLSLYDSDNQEQIVNNRQNLAESVNISFDNFIFQQQIHSNNVRIVTKADIGKGSLYYFDGFTDNDAMITNEVGVCLNVMAGDCVPIIFRDPIKKVISVAHAGWRGTYKQIAKTTVKKMISQFGCDACDILAGIGPSISQKNYEVDDKVYTEFEKRFENLTQIFTESSENGKYYLNLWEANKQQLISSGLKEENGNLRNCDI